MQISIAKFEVHSEIWDSATFSRWDKAHEKTVYTASLFEFKL